MVNKEQGKQMAEVQFNLGAKQLEIIGELLHLTSEHYLRGEMEKMVFTLKNVKQQIISRLLPEERRDLVERELRIQVIGTMVRKKKVKRNVLTHIIHEYDTRIRELLEIKGFLVPVKSDTTGLFMQEDPEQVK